MREPGTSAEGGTASRIHPQNSEPSSALPAQPTQLHQVLLNLCVNARGAMPQGGALYLRGENCTLDADAAGAAN